MEFTGKTGLRAYRARLAVSALILGAALSVATVRADDFDRLEGRALADAPKLPSATAHESLSVADLLALPPVLRDSRAAPVIVKTDQGNFARLIIAPGLRKSAGGKGEPIPVLVIERFDVFDAGRLSTRLARGRDLVLFGGFQVDLDAGLVVPNDQGADLRFVAAGPGEGVLETVGGAKIYTFKSTPLPASNAVAAATAGLPAASADFNGRWQLFVDGRWSGLLELKVSVTGDVGGFFRSDTNGASYDVSGHVAPESSETAAFKVSFPQAEMDFDARLWTQGRGVIAGTSTMRGRGYGFFAFREGFKLQRGDNPDAAAGFSNVVVAIVGEGRFQLNGEAAIDAETLAEKLRLLVRQTPAARVTLRAAAATSFRDLDAARARVAGAGVEHIEIEPLAAVKPPAAAAPK